MHGSPLTNQLGQGDPSKDLGIVDHQGPCQTHGRRASCHGHGDDVHGNAKPGRIDHHLAELQGKPEGTGRADIEGEDGAFLQFLFSPAMAAAISTIFGTLCRSPAPRKQCLVVLAKIACALWIFKRLRGFVHGSKRSFINIHVVK